VLLMTRDTRYQGAIVRDHHLLLIRHQHHAGGRTYWLVPGGGIEPGEGEEDCVRREMQEETGLNVQVQGLLIDEAGLPGGIYRWMKTYLCSVLSGEAVPGYEPEEEAAAQYAIVEARWFDLRAPRDWFALMENDPFTCPLVVKICLALGYAAPYETPPGGIPGRSD
jgi:8-oxo-dGTP pyrophosphatase MutT (NUDIX family)